LLINYIDKIEEEKSKEKVIEKDKKRKKLKIN